MFCTEPIKKVFYLEAQNSHPDSNCFLRFCPCMEYHTTDGRWLILQTEHHYIKIGTDGVSLESDFSAYRFPEYDYMDLDDWEPEDEDDAPFTSPESATFSGERLISCRQKENGMVIQFNHFTLDVFFYAPEDFPWDFMQSQYIPIPALDHRLTRICDCGGKGEVMLDFVHDFIVRCHKCHKATSPTFDLQDEIDCWNDGYTSHAFETDEEQFWPLSSNPIDRIAMSKEHSKYDENLYDCRSMMLVMREDIFEISSQLIAKDTFGFSFNRYSAYNPEHWPFVIHATEETPIVFLGKESGENLYPVLRYQIGEKNLIVTADGEGNITFGWVNRSDAENDEKSLFNEVVD